MIGCPCEVCKSPDSRDKRLRSSISIEINNQTLVIDAGPDFRQQMLRAEIDRLDAILFTHAHRDHTAGLDDIRAYNFFMKQPMAIYATEETQRSLQLEYHYAFADQYYPGLPEFKFFTFQNQPFYIGDVRIIPVEVMHYKMKVYGFRINNFTYITDANMIAHDEMEKIKGSKVLILNALRKEAHISHFNLQEALDLIAEIKPEKAYLTHLSHQMGKHADIERELPDGVMLGFDGLRLEL